MIVTIIMNASMKNEPTPCPGVESLYRLIRKDNIISYSYDRAEN